MEKKFSTTEMFTQHFLKKKWHMGISLLVLAFIMTGIIVALPRANAAQAAGTPTITISPTSGAYTDRDDQTPITVHGTNFAANETVKVFWNYNGPGTGILEVTTRTSGNGAFTASFLYQLAAAGTYTIAAVGQTSGDVASGTFTLRPQLSIRPQAGGPGSSTTFYGNAFAAGESVKIYWKYTGPGTGTLLATTGANSTGSFAVTVNVPISVTPGSYVVAGVGQASQLVAKYKFTIFKPTLELAPMSGSASTPLLTSAYGFTGGEIVDFFWNKGTTPVTTVTVSNYGYLPPTTITVPAGAAPGNYEVRLVGRSSSIAITNTFTVIAPASTLKNTAGPVGATVKVTGQGYAPNEMVNILWNYTAPGTGTPVASLTAGYAGTIQGTFTVPFAANGSYNVAAVGVSSQSVTQNPFTIGNSLATSPATTSPNTSITITGTGFQAAETVNLFLDSAASAAISTTTADINGNINNVVSIPANTPPGLHSLIGVGQTSGQTFTTPITIDTNWGDFGFDYAHHRQNFYENSLNASNAANLQLKWTATTNVGLSDGLKDSPVYANGTVYINTMDGRLDAYDATTGTQKWEFNCQCIFRSFSSPMVDANAGLVFFGTVGYADEGIPSPFYALDAQTGTLKWSLILPWHQLGFPTLAFNTLYVGISHLDHGACVLFAFDEVSGHINWQLNTNAGVWGAVAVDTSTKTVFTGVGNPASAVIAVNATTGALVWNQAIPQFGPDDDVGSGITVNNGLVYTSSKNGSVYALNESTGVIAWSTPIGAKSNGNISTQAISSQGILYVGSINKSLYALNATTGAVLWRSATGGPIFSSPAIANGVIYFASLDHKFYAVDASTGALLWSYTTGLYSYSSPIVVNGWLYCGSADGKLYAFHL